MQHIHKIVDTMLSSGFPKHLILEVLKTIQPYLTEAERSAFVMRVKQSKV